MSDDDESHIEIVYPILVPEYKEDLASNITPSMKRLEKSSIDDHTLQRLIHQLAQTNFVCL